MGTSRSPLSVSEVPSELGQEPGPLCSSPVGTFSQALETSNSSWPGSFILGRLAQTSRDSAVLGFESRGALAGCIYNAPPPSMQHSTDRAGPADSRANRVIPFPACFLQPLLPENVCETSLIFPRLSSNVQPGAKMLCALSVGSGLTPLCFV